MDIEDFVNGVFDTIEAGGRFLKDIGDSIFGTAEYDDDDEDFDDDDEDDEDDEDFDEDDDDDEDEYDLREAERKHIIAEKRGELTADINTNLRSFSAKTRINPENKVTASQCTFRSFEADMRPMTDSVEAEIRAKFRWRTRKIQSAEELLKQIGDVIFAIKQNDIQP